MPSHRFNRKQGEFHHSHMASPPALLLDLDGVVFRHPEASALLHRRVERFVSIHARGQVSASNASSTRVMAVHEGLYRHYGHTLLGLREAHGCSATVSDFNRFVFDATFLDAVRAMPMPLDFDRHAASVRDLVRHARNQRGARVCIFTNAPRVWVRLALAATGVWMPDADILSGEVHVKPEAQAYALAQAAVGSDASVTFVDDAQLNLDRCPRLWRAVLFDDSPDPMEEGPSCERTGVRRVRSLEEVKDWI